jgi:hypothetical protein
MIHLPSVTLLGIDCVDLNRLALAAEICSKNFVFAEVKLLSSLPAGSNQVVIPIEPLDSAEKYSEFVITRLNDFVDTEHVLIFQYDGFILNPKAWTNEFLKYDYIGSPLLINDWAVRTFDLNPEMKGDWVVGNGGFCLRSKKLLNKIHAMHIAGDFDEYHAEDVVICIKKRKLLESEGFTFAPIEVAEQFSFEYGTVDGRTAWTNEFGFHGLNWSDISAWIKNNPEYTIKNPFDRKSYEE